MVDWLEFYGNQSGFSYRQIDGVESVEMPIYEAIYIAQQLVSPRNNQAYIEPDRDTILNFPNPAPAVYIKDVEVDFSVGSDRGLEDHLNPLLSPSIDLMQRRYPKFFQNDQKYLTRKRYYSEDLETMRQSDRVCITFPRSPDQTGEGVTNAAVSQYLRREGYIVDPFGGGMPGHGAPDLYAIKLPKLQRKLAKAGITGGGFYLNELELPSVEKVGTVVPDESKTVVLELESSYDKGRFYAAKDEAMEYLEGGWFDEGYGVMGFADERLDNWRDRLEVGFITFTEDGQFISHECPNEYGKRTDQVKQKVENVVKLTLLKNQSMTKTFEFLDVNSFFDASKAVNDRSLDEIIEFVDI